MDVTSLLFSMLFGTVGMGFLMYAKKAGLLVPALAGLALMVCPYFIPSVVAMVFVCSALIAVPFVLRDA